MGKPKWNREFLGKIKDFDSLEEAKFEKKHLKAYLRGLDEFKYGYEMKLDRYGNEYSAPIVHKVKQILNKID